MDGHNWIQPGTDEQKCMNEYVFSAQHIIYTQTIVNEAHIQLHHEIAHSMFKCNVLHIPAVPIRNMYVRYLW